MIEIGWSMYTVTQRIIQLDLITMILGLAHITIIIQLQMRKLHFLGTET